VAEAMIAAGAGRIGTANAVAIVSGFAKLRQVS
jgi:deoxyribose-phosphate aldolase